MNPHQDYMSVCFISSYTPLFYSKTGVYRGIHYFLIFALKHKLWVFVRTASTCTHNICFEPKYEKSKKQSTVIFTDVKYCSILHRRVCVILGYDTHRNDRSVNPHGVVFFAAKQTLSSMMSNAAMMMSGQWHH